MDVDKAAAAIAQLLDAFGIEGDDHTRDTPGRVARAWAQMLAGYAVDPGCHLDRTFTAPPDPGLVVVAGIRVATTCAHHLLPVTGTATVAYRPRPGQRITGLSKLARVVEDYAARLQVQERLCHQVASTIAGRLDPDGAGCVITAGHGCITARGVRQPAVTTTTAWCGTWGPGHPDVAVVLAQHHGTAHHAGPGLGGTAVLATPVAVLDGHGSGVALWLGPPCSPRTCGRRSATR